MKTPFFHKHSFWLIFISCFFLITQPELSVAQDKPAEKSKETKMVIKIIKDENGRTTTIDTSFTISGNESQKEIEAYLEQYEDALEDLDDELKSFEIYVDDLDSMKMDSLKDHFIIMKKNVGHPRYKWECDPGNFQFDYDFDMPCPPPPPMPPAFPEFDNGKGNLLNMLRGIPMDRIRSFRIKEKKNGSRIIIDVDHTPVLGNSFPQGPMIYINKERKGTKGEADEGKKVEKKIIIKTDDQEVK